MWSGTQEISHWKPYIHEELPLQKVRQEQETNKNPNCQHMHNSLIFICPGAKYPGKKNAINFY